MTTMGICIHFSKGAKSTFCVSRLLMMQHKWPYTKHFTLSIPQRKCSMLRQQLHMVFTL